MTNPKKRKRVEREKYDMKQTMNANSNLGKLRINGGDLRDQGKAFQKNMENYQSHGPRFVQDLNNPDEYINVGNTRKMLKGNDGEVIAQKTVMHSASTMMASVESTKSKGGMNPGSKVKPFSFVGATGQ